MLFLVFLSVVSVLSVVQLFAAAAPPPIYRNDFEKAEEGEPPKEFTILNGAFAVRAVEGNKRLEAPGDPVDSNAITFGPEDQSELSVRATVFASASGKRTPEFGVGLGDANGYKLWVMPATAKLQIIKGEDVVAEVPFEWKSGSPTVLKLQVTRVGKQTGIDGKAWVAGSVEPKAWTVSHTDPAEPPKGRPSLWASTYSSTPIGFDNLVVARPED